MLQWMKYQFFQIDGVKINARILRMLAHLLEVFVEPYHRPCPSKPYDQPLPVWNPPALFPIQICTSIWIAGTQFLRIFGTHTPVPKATAFQRVFKNVSRLYFEDTRRSPAPCKKIAVAFQISFANLDRKQSGRFSCREWLVVRFYKHVQQMHQDSGNTAMFQNFTLSLCPFLIFHPQQHGLIFEQYSKNKQCCWGEIS